MDPRDLSRVFEHQLTDIQGNVTVELDPSSGWAWTEKTNVVTHEWGYVNTSGESKYIYDRKRAEDKRHTQAVLALARRRVNVLCAHLRDGRCYQTVPPEPVAA